MPYRSYVYPAPVIVERPRVYVQQEPPIYVQQEPGQHYWYYCESARTYYHYIQQCPEGWMTVVPPTAAPTR